MQNFYQDKKIKPHENCKQNHKHIDQKHLGNKRMRLIFILIMVSIAISTPCQTIKYNKSIILGTWYLTKRETNGSVKNVKIWDDNNCSEFLTLEEDYIEFNLRNRDNSGGEREAGFQVKIDEINNEILYYPYFLSQDTTCRGVTNHLVSYNKKGDTLILFNFNEYYGKKTEVFKKEYYLPYPKSIPLLEPSIDDEKW